MIKLNTKKCRALLAEKRISQASLARSLGIARPTVSRLMTGRQNPSEKLTRRIAERLGVELEEIIEFTDGLHALSDQEALLVSMFRKCSTMGKAEALMMVRDMMVSPPPEPRSESDPDNSEAFEF